jgi:hypothetical protein
LQPDFVNPYFYIAYMNWFFGFSGVMPSEDSTKSLLRRLSAPQSIRKIHSLLTSGTRKNSSKWTLRSIAGL